MNIEIIIQQANRAHENHFYFSEFVKNSEEFINDEIAIPEKDKRCSYSKYWFEMEIINALALEAWESDGSPLNWQNPWDENYKDDAINLITKLCNLFNQ